MADLSVGSWGPVEVEGFLRGQGLDAVATAFRVRSISGVDLLKMSCDDIVAQGCTPMQAKMVADALAAQGIQLRPSAGPPPASYPSYMPATSPPINGYAGAAHPSATYGYPAPSPAPAGISVPCPAPPAYMTSPAPSSLSAAHGSQELAELKQQVARESVKSDLRQEMDVCARLAAAEAVQRAGGHGASIMHTEQYCGPISWIIGIFLFPCIFLCPVDTRTVTVVA